ncbi:MAG: alpha-glucan family phosphorylase, partial [Elusimicrobia bacterium]|nr:alpha-glucan family phosphorylase [Elusimicrobiota bacterium]
GMFPNYPIHSITNGVHAATWTSPPVQELLDERIPDWRTQNLSLRYAVAIPLEEVQRAHLEAKHLLLEEVERRTGRLLSHDAFTIGFARRAAEYKRADLLFTDLERLRRIAREQGALQILFAGKAHPQDGPGKALIRRVFEAAAQLDGPVPVFYLEEHDMTLGRLLCAGVDLWLNTPKKPHEASGTSGMKAALNGVPSLSVLDGWWIEGHVEGVTGWSVGEHWDTGPDRAAEAASLYDKLEKVIVPLYYKDPAGFAKVMRSSMSINGSFFNAQRMVTQYLESSYRLDGR